MLGSHDLRWTLPVAWDKKHGGPWSRRLEQKNFDLRPWVVQVTSMIKWVSCYQHPQSWGSRATYFWISSQVPSNIPMMVHAFANMWWLNLALQNLADMVASWNGDTPKSCLLMGFSLKSHPFWGTPFQETPSYTDIYSMLDGSWPWWLEITGWTTLASQRG